MFGWKKQKQSAEIKALPEHIAIIMDGNGRYAKQRNRPRVNGHYEGMQNVKRITRHASDIGIKYLTLYAFSTENWSRPKSEVSYLMKLPGDFLGAFLPELIEKNVKVITIGNNEALPEHTVNAVSEAVEKTRDNTGMRLVFALNYGGRDELIRSIKAIAEEVSQGTLDKEEINQDTVDAHLYTKGIPEPEMMIRTSGEYRLSNFLLWQSSYSELFFTNTFWPEFTTEELDGMISQYQRRSRRFGGLDEEEV
ncbi:isoprenyl transferase [Salinicoccus halodurans]|uniref:Isoprenyl transferase n=1 Tax=Salinicoccus halodurans TaxID=407035 RepID=A0A0F7HJX9_9STAP|nr:isoprenyl transferase [Salinicoccus halodurans]AKG73784.1 UDP pyrophosphate synthase [Salinicoccus halodurans]SFK55837.1 undecaprenyl diphosphate synthase [Salinicoccus halodurans]